MYKTYLITLIAIGNILSGAAQFTLDGEFRPRTEYRHGFGSILADSIDPGFAISSRMRLKAGYQTDNYELFISRQDVMLWGENAQLQPLDQNHSFSVFEAWAEFPVTGNLSTRLGRQQLAYDNERILGGLEWAQQARNHDALLFKYASTHLRIDLGLAYNQDFPNPAGFQSQGNTYNRTTGFSYKSMQFLYLKKNWKAFSGSLLLLNNGFQEFNEIGQGDGLSNLLTLGPYMSYNQGRANLMFQGYMQLGRQQNRLDVEKAFMLGLDMSYLVSAKVNLGLGASILSGDDPQTANASEAFIPLYGTNHKFNGLMDYFYVGNHANSVGLIDFHLQGSIELGATSSIDISLLEFLSHRKLARGKQILGTEADLV